MELGQGMFGGKFDPFYSDSANIWPKWVEGVNLEASQVAKKISSLGIEAGLVKLIVGNFW